jgi:hypothetical protein
MFRLLLSSAVLAFCVGCGGSGSTSPATSSTAAATSSASTSSSTASATTTAPTAAAGSPTIDLSKQPLPKLPVADNSTAPEKKVDAAADAKKSDSEQRPGTVLDEAQVGVGAKGHYSEGVILTPVATMFRAEEMIAFKIQIPQAMQLFKATNNRGPKSNEEFMEKIIKENHIPLPELPEGQRFFYDPKTEQLMVERPAK